MLRHVFSASSLDIFHRFDVRLAIRPYSQRNHATVCLYVYTSSETNCGRSFSVATRAALMFFTIPFKLFPTPHVSWFISFFNFSLAPTLIAATLIPAVFLGQHTYDA